MGALLRGVVAAGVCLLVPARLAAQAGVQGTVVEAGTGTPVAAATVELQGAARVVVSTDRRGAWSLPALAAGTYSVRVTHPGFAPRVSELRVPAAGGLRLALTPRPVVLDAVVATASRRTQTLAEAPVATEVVTAAEIERSGATDLAAALRGRAGIEVQGGHPSGSGVMLQGLGSERVLVLLDGEPVVGRLSGQLDLSRIPVSAVERVEVVKGPQSVLYGSDAMGGVINVITRAPSRGQRSGRASITAGSNGRVDGGAAWRGTAGRFGWSLDGGLRTADVAPGVRETDGALVERRDALAGLSWQPSGALAGEASLLVLDERERWRSGQLFIFADNLQWSGRLGARWQGGAHRIRPSVYASEFRHLSRRGTGPEPASTGEEESQRLAEASVLYGWSAGAHALDAGLEISREAITSDRVEGHDRTLTEADLFAQHSWGLGRWTLVPGGRLSLSERWGEHATPRLAVMYRPVDALALRASAGTGFRGPSFKELYMAFANDAAGYRVRGNPDLRPESSRNLTVGVEWAGARAFLRAQAFSTRYDDFIETREVGPVDGLTVYEYRNVDDGSTRGLELAAGAARGPLRLEAGYSRLWTEDRSTGRPLLGRPAHSGRASLDWAHPAGVRAHLSASYTGRAPVDDAGEAVVYRDAFLALDARISQELPRGLQIALGADNLLDATPDEWPGFVGRQLYLSLIWKARGER